MENKIEEKPKERMSYREAKYLKDAGEKYNIKVTIRPEDGIYVVHMRDFVFESFKNALRFIQEDSQNIVSNEIRS